MKWLGEKQIPFLMIFTKIDKLGKTELKKNIENYKTEMLKQWEEIPQTFFASVPKRKGSKEILDFIEKTNLTFYFLAFIIPDCSPKNAQ